MTKTKNKVLLFNPRSANAKYRIPNSVLQIGASIHGLFEYVFVDGNLELDAWETIEKYLKTDNFKYFGCTVMPGPQLRQAIPFTKKIKENYPEVIIIWGGYFASNQYKVSIESGFVDYIINGPGDKAFPNLLNALEEIKFSLTAEWEFKIKSIKNLIYKDLNDKIIKTPKEDLLEQDILPALPYQHLANFYPLEKYLGKTYLGNKTFSYHSSFGCPFTCSFCAVVPIYEARWKGKSAKRIFDDILFFKEKYAIDAIEFHDNNFFTSRKRVVEFSRLMLNQNIIWWGEGRIDTIDKYSDEELLLMRKAGCKMIFLGAESGNDELLKQMDKGGTQTAEQMKAFVARMKTVDIIPELSFVLGFPAKNEETVWKQIKQDIEFIKEIKTINSDAEIIIYIYSPVPTEGSEMYELIKKSGFHFPEELEDWLSPAWEKFDLRKNPLTPWLKPYMIDEIRDFETVLNGFYPTVSDVRLNTWQRVFIKKLSLFRYKMGFYWKPKEIRLFQHIWKYRQPEIEGF
ncbi:B12-binding domain-containing radical SAM protein [Emticicia sp. SJ17W-69]|uniref:B12-binding domain-containing radical SAM protein n=1 Tax=Emticicia sp. SJ17W-69 TaxID=3421657 RepID=UPI003EB6FB5B